MPGWRIGIAIAPEVAESKNTYPCLLDSPRVAAILEGGKRV
jgi:hypothetical protein